MQGPCNDLAAYGVEGSTEGECGWIVDKHKEITTRIKSDPMPTCLPCDPMPTMPTMPTHHAYHIEDGVQVMPVPRRYRT